MNKNIKKIHCIGIKGVGMTGIATLFKQMGNIVQGSDGEEEFFTDAILKELSIPVFPFGGQGITDDIDEIIYSTAYGSEHVDMAAARELGIPMRSYSEKLAEVFNVRKGILVTGSHGKTTSTAMLGEVLVALGWDPTVLVGGEVVNWHRTARLGEGKWIVAEGDEYQAKILKLKSSAVLLTSIDYDHPDFFKDAESYHELFRKLVCRLSSEAVLVASKEAWKTLALSESDICARVVVFEQEQVELSVFGAHNMLNASGVLSLVCALGAQEDVAREALRKFRGTKRRLELYTPEDAAIVVFDDYAHHPTEIKASLSAIREHYPERHVTAIFQPHTYSRTKAFLDDFSDSFRDADHVIILDVYGSAREQKGIVGGKNLAKKIKEKGKTVEFISTTTEVVRILQKRRFANNSLIVTLGAGDVWQIASEFVKKVRRG